MRTEDSLSSIRFVFDENLLGLARGIGSLRRDVAAVGTPPLADLLPAGVVDPDWIPIVASRAWIMVTNDHSLRTRPGEAQLAIDHELKVIHLKGRIGHQSAWLQARRLIGGWEAVESQVAVRGPWWLSMQATHPRVLTFEPGAIARQ